MVARHDPSSGDEPPNNARVRRALNLVKPHLDAFVRQKLTGVPGARVSSTADVQELLNTMLAHSVHFFDGRSGKALRNCVYVLRESRNRSAHEQPFTDREARHAIDTVGILAEFIDAPRTVIDALDALNASPTGRSVLATVEPERPAREPAREERPPSSASRPRPVYEADVIINAAELTAGDVAMRRVRCPGCGRHDFAEWSAGWDAHAAYRCSGMTADTPEERKEEFRSRFAHLFMKTRRRGQPSQRDVMRRIWSSCRCDEECAVRAYADAERRGEAVRASNEHGVSPEDYAHALIYDGLKKGWLRPCD